VVADLHARLADLLSTFSSIAARGSPSRHVGRVEAVERARLDDDVLQDLVDRVPDVDLAVRVGRAVVQDELRPPGTRGADLSVDVFLVPARQHLRLALREVRLHRELGLRQVQCVLVVFHARFFSGLPGARGE